MGFCVGIADLLAAYSFLRSVSRMPDEDRGQQRISWAKVDDLLAKCKCELPKAYLNFSNVDGVKILHAFSEQHSGR